MLLLGLLLIITGVVIWYFAGGLYWIVIGGILGIVLMLLDIVDTIHNKGKKQIQKHRRKKDEKNRTKVRFDLKCRYISGMPFDSGDCEMSIIQDRIFFDVEGIKAALIFLKIADVKVTEDGVFKLIYRGNEFDADTSPVILEFDPQDINKFKDAAKFIRSNITYMV